MDTLQKYKKIYIELESFNKKLASLYQQVEANKAKHTEEISNAKRRAATDLEENNNRIAKVSAFIEIARTHSITHTNASGPKPFDSGALSRLSVQINSSQSNDAHAVLLYHEATAQLMYLRSFADTIVERNNEYLEYLSSEFKKLNSNVENQILILKSEIEKFLFSNSFSSFLEEIQNDRIVFGGNSEKSTISTELIGTVSIGSVELPFPIPKDMETKFSDRTKGLCNIVKSTISVPANLNINNGMVILAEFTNSTEFNVLKGLQNILLNYLRYYSKELKSVTYIDPIRYNSNSLGCLSNLCGENSIIDIVPNSEEAIRKKIKSLVEIVSKSSNEKQAFKRVLVFHDFPQSYDSASVSLIQQLCANAEFFGITVILTHNRSANKQVDSDIYYFIKNIAINITIDDDNCFYFSVKNGEKHTFMWYSAPQHLPSDIEQIYINEKPIINLDNNYINRIGLNIATRNEKGVRNLENIPYGLDSEGHVLCLDFENTNFATYICGASRSGKSTLIHTIITGILQSTHPDNVEIWLVDFGKTEFSRYVNKNIPHIRYIILDESPELVYDLVDRLTEIMMSRQNSFMGKWEKLSDVPKEKYMPELFVVIDEFSIMSNILANSVTMAKEDYRIKLQTILAKSAKLGMRFIFSSQGFTEGTRGLTEMAKDQIQQRIAMKADYTDIKSTLDLKTISDRDELLMEQLPVHYALKRIPLTEQGDRLNSAHVMYIPNADSQLPLIESLNQAFNPQKKYDPSIFESYIYKRPMIKDGNSFEIFDEQIDAINDYINDENNPEDEKKIDMFVGSPQRMLELYPIEMVDGFCENCLVVAPTREKTSASALVMSAVRSLQKQGVFTECWTSAKNPVYRQITKECNFAFNKSYTRIEDICTRISKLRQSIENRTEANSTIFIMNYEILMMDMQYLAEEKKSGNNENLALLNEFGSIRRDEGEKDLNTILLELDLVNDGPIVDSTPSKSSVTVQISSVSIGTDFHAKVYDARNDLKYILTHGSRWGYHFVMLFDTCGDFRQTKLDESLFRHRIMFQTAKNEAVGIVSSSFAESVSNLTNHIFRYTNGIEEVSFRPYLHCGLSIDGWSIQGQNAVNTIDEDDYLE